MKSTLVHICVPSWPIRAAIYAGLETLSGSIKPGIVEARWLANYEWGFGRDLVVIAADSPDVWPVLIKVRALSRLEAYSIVISPGHLSDICRRRLEHAGASAVVSGFSQVSEILEQIASVAQLTRQQPPRPLPGHSNIPDRPLQIACMYVSSMAPSAQEIANYLGMSIAGVRTGIARARAELSDSGYPVGTRKLLREALIQEGYFISDQGVLL